jgi:hypothetical protein
MKSLEHRAVGEAATGGACVNVGGAGGEQRLVLGYGDVIALSGDFFAGAQAGPQDDLFTLAAIPGNLGTRLGSRDEVICALKVMTVDGDFVDARFEPGGRFGHFCFTDKAAATEVERRVRDRFLALATANGDHFVAPGHSTAPHSSGFPSAIVAYRRLHEAAIDEACRLGRCQGDESRAMAREAAAQHYLTDAFAAGHLRTPVSAIRQFWLHRYPRFWQDLQRKVAADTASALRELLWPARFLPDRFLYDRTHAAVKARTKGYPPITFGDLLARVFHDWDNIHGLTLESGGTLYGDGLLERGVGRKLVISAVRAGIDDIEVAYRLGASGSQLRGAALYQAVRSATGAPDATFLPETWIPRPSADNPPQNWWAPDIETLWDLPIVGITGPTVGMAVEQTLHPGTEVFRRLDGLGPGVFEVPALRPVPALQRWVARKAGQAYHEGFIRGLARDPKATTLAIVGTAQNESDMETYRGSGVDLTPICLHVGEVIPGGREGGIDRDGSVQWTNLDLPLPDPGLVGGLGYRSRAAHDVAVGEPEGTPMPRADDAAIGKLALIEGTAGMAAGVRQCVDLPVLADQQHRSLTSGDPAQLTLGQFRLREHRRPLLRAVLEEGVINVDPLGERQVTAEISADDQDPETGKPEHLAGTSSTATPSEQRGGIQAQRHHVRGRVYRPDTPLCADGVRPVVETRCCGGDRAEDAGADKQVCGLLGLRSTEDVQ